MTDEEIIEFFFMYGCTGPSGEKLPLRNCEKINFLYNRDLGKEDCCDFHQQKIYELYKHRLKEFLEVEATKEPPHSVH
jgi:hypothetical protein